MLGAFGTEPTTGGLVHDSVYQNSVRRAGCAQGHDRRRGRRAGAGGGTGGRYGATRMEGLEEGARQAGPSFRGCLLL
jgi:hypothetical protein